MGTSRDGNQDNSGDSSRIKQYTHRLNMYIKSLTAGDEVYINELPALRVEAAITGNMQTTVYAIIDTQSKHTDEFCLRTGDRDSTEFPTIIHPDNTVHQVDLIAPHNETIIGGQTETLDYDRIPDGTEANKPDGTSDTDTITDAAFTIPTDATRVDDCVYCETPLYRFTPETTGEEIVYCSNCDNWAYAEQYDAAPLDRYIDIESFDHTRTDISDLAFFSN